MFETSKPDATSLTVSGLRPYTGYKLRLLAENIAGKSLPSEPTRNFQTIQAAPSGPPPEVPLEQSMRRLSELDGRCVRDTNTCLIDLMLSTRFHTHKS